MTRRALLGLGLASIMATGPGPGGDGRYVRLADGRPGDRPGAVLAVERRGAPGLGRLRAFGTALPATTTVGVSYSSEKSITCRDGSDGSIFRFFEGGGSGSFFVGRSLAAATGAVKAHGDEGWFNTCTEGSGSVGKAYLVAFAIGATSRLTTETMTQDILWEDGVCYLLTQHFASREAHGGVLVNGHPFGTSSATIGHTDWDSVPQAASACDEE